MRYKGEYHPQFILGRSCCSPQKPLQHLTYLDPETYAWDPLNEDARRRLDARKYVSLSRERRLGVDVRPTTEVGVLPHQRDALLEEAPMMGDGRKSPDNGGDGDDDGDDFTASMPGALTLAQVLSTIDLDRVRVNVGPHFCTTDVSGHCPPPNLHRQSTHVSAAKPENFRPYYSFLTYPRRISRVGRRARQTIDRP
jgi:hypothetical protein